MTDEIANRVLKLREASNFEEHAHQARLAIWNCRNELFGGNVPSHPLDIIDPTVALYQRGFNIESDADLGEMWDQGCRTRVAATIDSASRRIRVAVGLSDQERRFTTAHELGHVLLHPDMNGLHRDRAISGPFLQRDNRERDADAFSSCFIIPAKMLLLRFREIFGKNTFRLDEDAVFGLRLGTFDEARRSIRTRRDASLLVATACSYMGSYFTPLNRFFRVSPTAMAIRLEEVGLVSEKYLQRRW